uniref:carotenoid 9,10(9',10')-cleavage dioxygenase 1-like n=1 Tax=Erigeron canadensis TaxID=72917 RepID=UPI001CB95CB4|nr:carotenoid 9,10(9',10')-cleavage dioxygenase 1-like [Erigeron canadensis]
MATTTCFLLGVKCSTNNRPVNFAVGHLKTALSTAVKPMIGEMGIATLKSEASKAIKMAPLSILNTLVDSIFQFVDQPMLPSQANFAPVDEIGGPVKVNCSHGEIPEDFPEGVFVRNGSNPLFGGLKSTVSVFGKTDSIWIEGEGMLHALYVTKDAEGNWTVSYNNRFVETETYKMETERKRPCFLPAVEGDPAATLASSFFNMLRFGEVNKIMSNTNVFEHGGKYYSIAENYVPQEIDLVSLATYGNWNLNGAWSRPFTSHPKKVPGTGELVMMGFEPMKPYCVMGVISVDGKELIHKFDLQLDHCSICHEVGVTKQYNVLIDSMLTLSKERVIKGGQLFKYEREKDARIAVIPRYGDADSIKWFHIERCCTYHLLNSFEDGDEVVVRGCKANAAIIPGPGWGENKFEWFSKGFNFKTGDSGNRNGHGMTEEGMLFTRVREWRLNLETMEVKEKDITGTEYSMDFPMINADFIGLKHQYGYTQVIDSLASSKSAKTKYGGLAKLYFEVKVEEQDTNGEQNIKTEYHWLPKNNFCTGSAFVAKPEAIDEDDGWIITFAHDEDTNKSYVLVIDAKKFCDEPTAKINLPQRVPYGHHGSFFAST